MTQSQPRSVCVIIGAGGMGLAVARRIGSGRQLLIADFSEKALDSATDALASDGHLVSKHLVDISDLASVRALAASAAGLGTVEVVVHTAGLSPMQASARQIYQVDLLGTANVIEAFEAIVTPGSAMVCVASMAGYSAKLPEPIEAALATGPIDGLLSNPAIHPDTDDPGMAYVISKRANHLRVQAKARAYGAKGGRINSISPGVISTAMGQAELAGAAGQYMKAVVAASASQRYGTPDDIAAAVAFLLGRDATFIHGVDLCVDGGATAARWNTP